MSGDPVIRFALDIPMRGRFQVRRRSFHLVGWCYHVATKKPVTRIFLRWGDEEIDAETENREDVARAYNLDHHGVGFRIFVPSRPGLQQCRIFVEAEGEITHLKTVPLCFTSFTPFTSRSHQPRSPAPAVFIPKPVEKLNDFETWCKRNRWNMSRRFHLEQKLSGLPSLRISIILPVYNPPLEVLQAALRSLEDQVYTDWEVCIADDCSTREEVRPFLEALAQQEPRVKLVLREENGHISAATTSAARLATGEFLIFLDQDDALTPDALAEVALYLHAHPETDVVYSDEDKITPEGHRRYDPQFKPDWSPEQLLSCMYLGHLYGIRTSLFHAIGGARIGFEGAQDYDLMLRATEQARQVGHLPRILYHWRAMPGSTASGGDEKDYSISAGLRALQDALDRRGIAATAIHPEWAKQMHCGYYELTFPDTGPEVAVLIPTRNNPGVLSRCLSSLRRTRYRNFRVYVIDNASDDPETLELLKQLDHSVIRVPSPESGFNYSSLNNQAVSRVEADLVLFLNDDTEVIEPTWLSQMVGVLQIDGVEAVGARLFYPDGTLQHAGVINDLHNGLPGHAFKHRPGEAIGEMGLAAILKNASAVTAACMLVRRKTFLDLGGFDETAFGISYNDVDLCNRIRERGGRIAVAPAAKLMHHEGASRGITRHLKEELAFLRNYKNTPDPYYNPNLLSQPETYRIRGRCRISEPVSLLGVRVGFFSHNLNLEGAPIQLFEIAEGLLERTNLTPILFSPLEGPLRDVAEAAGIEVVVIPPDVLFELASLHSNAVRRLTAWCRPFELDVVFANTLLNFWAVEIAQHLQIPALWLIHESEPPFQHLDPWSEEARQAAWDCLGMTYQNIFVSEATRDLYRPHLPESNSTVVYNGLDPERMKSRFPISRNEARDALHLKEKDLFVLCVGTVCARKGQSTLLQAVAGLNPDARSRVQVALVGHRDTDEAKQIEALFDTLSEDVRKRITFYPQTWEIGTFYAAADVFVCASTMESYPKVILEAMYSGCAILTTPVFGIREQIIPEVSALTFAPEDAEELTCQLETLLDDPSRLEQLRENARLQLQRLPGYTEMLDDYQDLITECLFQ